MRLRKLVAFERLLARLMVAAPERWVLKGALAFHFRLAARFQNTKDMDLGRWDEERPATEDLVAMEHVDLSARDLCHSRARAMGLRYCFAGWS